MASILLEATYDGIKSALKTPKASKILQKRESKVNFKDGTK